MVLRMKRRRPSGRRMRRTMKRRRIVRRRVRQARMAVKRTFYVENWQPNSAGTNGFWRYYQFTASQLPSMSEFVALFDQYKINAVKVTFRPRFDSFQGNNTTDTTLPGVTNQSGTNMHVIRDPYTTTFPTGTYTVANMNSFMEQGNVKSYTGNRPFSIYIRPTNNFTVDGANVERKRSKYINTSNLAIPHFGFHAYAQDNNFSGTFGNSWDVFYTYYMTFKNLR